MLTWTGDRKLATTHVRRHVVGAALALALMQVAGTPEAFGQNPVKGKKQAAAAPAGTATFSNQPATGNASGQPGMAATAQAAAAAPPAPRLPSHTNAGKEKAPPADIKMQIDENNIVDLHVNDEDLSAVLEMLSIQSQRNIVASKNVSARVTANLYGVTFYEALEAILNVNGYGFIEEGNFIYVYTIDEIAAIEKQNRQRVSKVITLSYLSSVDAAEFVKPLLSDTGQIKTNGKAAGFPSLGDTPQGNEEYALASSIVVYDYEDNVAEIETLIKQIDTRPSQVLVEATILQTTLNEANAFGVDFAIVGNMAFGDFVQVGGPLKAADALIAGKSGSTVLPADGGGSALASTVGNTAGAGGVKLGIVSNDVSVFLRMLDEVTDSTVLSNPKLLTLNRQAARVLVGRKVGYLNTTSTDTATTQTVEFLDTGTQLYFRPFVDMSQRTIRMELKPQVSEAVIRDVKDATGAAVTIPDEITNELSTNVMVRDGQTIVLGGLFRESTVATRRQWPLLGDIPLIGTAFRGNEDQTERSEIIFLITPSIVDDSTLALDGEKGKNAVDQARAGARNGTLKWSRDRITSQLNVEAEKLAADGQTEKALWKLERSLSLSPMQPEVIAMREKLTGTRKPVHNRSLLDNILKKEVDAAKKSSGILTTDPATTQASADQTTPITPTTPTDTTLASTGSTTESTTTTALTTDTTDTTTTTTTVAATGEATTTGGTDPTPTPTTTDLAASTPTTTETNSATLSTGLTDSTLATTSNATTADSTTMASNVTTTDTTSTDTTTTMPQVTETPANSDTTGTLATSTQTDTTGSTTNSTDGSTPATTQTGATTTDGTTTQPQATTTPQTTDGTSVASKSTTVDTPESYARAWFNPTNFLWRWYRTTDLTKVNEAVTQVPEAGDAK
jgi:type IV pilus assembly protein PilQ